jgi:C4-type Zn-finger protein
MNDLSILRGPYIKKNSKQNMKIDIPLPCPSCGGKMYSVNYEASFTILKKRSWQVCKECDFERNTDEFKKTICCA